MRVSMLFAQTKPKMSLEDRIAARRAARDSGAAAKRTPAPQPAASSVSSTAHDGKFQDRRCERKNDSLLSKKIQPARLPAVASDDANAILSAPPLH